MSQYKEPLSTFSHYASLTAEDEPVTAKLDYPEFRRAIKDFNPESVWYGPHTCTECGRPYIMKHAVELGAEAYEVPCTRNNNKYVPHFCTKVLLFKKLQGKVLTVLDASFSPESQQLKAIKSILKSAFSEIIDEARKSSGDTSCESEGDTNYKF